MFVNGGRVAGAAVLEPGCEVIVGNQTFRWDGAQLLSSATQHEFTLYADGLSVVVAGGVGPPAEVSHAPKGYGKGYDRRSAPLYPHARPADAILEHHGPHPSSLRQAGGARASRDQAGGWTRSQ